MSYFILANKSNYITLIERFLYGLITAQKFSVDFLEMRTQDLNKDQKLKESWPEPYDQIIIQQYLSGLISKAEFSEQWHRIWMYPENDPFLTFYNKVDLDVHEFEPDPDLYNELEEGQPGFYVNDEQLYENVKSYYEEYLNEQK